jgi:surface antigen
MTTEASRAQHRGTSLWKPLVTILVIGFFFVGSLIVVVTFVVSSIGYSNHTQRCESGSPVNQAIGAVDDGLGVPEELHDEQLRNARIIDRTAAALGLSGQASRIAIIAAMGESSLINIDFGDEGKGVTNPDGSATTSKGLFQQQTSQGWGTVEQVTDPEHATKSFLLGPRHDGASRGLVTVSGWETGEITQVIHRVQRNSNANHYADSYGPAEKIIREAGIDVNRSADEEDQEEWRGTEARSPGDSAVAGRTRGSVADLDGCSTDGGTRAGVPGRTADGNNTYPWDAVTPAPGVYNVDPVRFFYGECTSYAAWKVNELMGGSPTDIIFDNNFGGHTKGNGGEWKSAWEASGWTVSTVPKVDSVAWWGPNGGAGVGAAGHVGWVDEITEDGRVIISEYNNSYYAPPGHNYSRRSVAIDPGQVGAYLYVPER